MFSYNINLNIDQEEILADLIATYGQEIMNITTYKKHLTNFMLKAKEITYLPN